MTNIKELEKMPTPYLNFLIHILSPLTQYLVCVIDILTWKNPNHSLLVVLLFNSVCIWTQRWLAFGLPCLLFVERIHVRCLITRRRCGSNDIGDEEIKRTRATGYEVEDTLHRLELIQSWWTHCYWKTDILPCISSLMTLNLVTLTSALIYVWPIWCMTNYFLLGSHRVIAAGGTWILVFNSNWYQALLYAIKKNYLFMLVEHNIALITYFFSRSSSSSKKKKELTGESNHQTSMTLPSFPRMISANQRHEIYRCEIPTTRI